MQRQRDLLVVAGGVLLGSTISTPYWPVVSGAVQVAPGIDVGVIPARAGGPRHEGIAPLAVGRHHRSAFFRGAIDIDGSEEAMPVNQFRRRGVVDHVYRHGAAFGETQDRAGERTVIADRSDGAFGSDRDVNGPDFERDVGRSLRVEKEGGGGGEEFPAGRVHIGEPGASAVRRKNCPLSIASQSSRSIRRAGFQPAMPASPPAFFEECRYGYRHGRRDARSTARSIMRTTCAADH